MIEPMDFIFAARVPDFLEPREFGLWQIVRRASPDVEQLGSA